MDNEAPLSQEQADRVIELALDEDTGHGDVTTEALIPPELEGKALIMAKAGGMLVGGEIAKRVFLRVDPSLGVEVLLKDGTRVKPGDAVATVAGRVTRGRV